MARWTPDPTFYPSPRMAAKAPAETLAYVAAFAPKCDVPDAIAVVDVDPASPTYSKIVGGVDMPALGDELHHYGWNACSSCLCPDAPHPHLERPLPNRSRLTLLAHLHHRHQARPENPAIVRVIEPEEVIEATGYSRPHTVHCGPDAIYVSALGSATGDGPGGVFLMDGGTFDVLGRFEVDRGPQRLAYDVWWHLGYDTMVTSEWGTPNTIENGLLPEILLGAQYGRRLHFWDLQKRKHLQEIDFGPDYQLVFELRPAHDPTKAYGFVNCVISLKDLSASIWTWYRDGDKWAVKKVIEIPAEPADPTCCPQCCKASGGAAAGDGYRPLDGRPLPLCRLLGHRRASPIRGERSLQPKAHRQGEDRRHRRAHVAPGGKWGAQRRPANGRDQPRRTARLLHQLALRRGGSAILPGRDRRLDGEARCRSRGRH